jgi:hypothetical protein
LPKVNSVIQGIRNTQSAIDLGTVTTPVPGILPQTQPSGAIAYYFFSPVSGGTYRIEFSGLNNTNGARFSVFLETSGGQQQLLNIIEVGGPDPGGKSYDFTPPAAGVVVISSDGRSNYGDFSIRKL